MTGPDAGQAAISYIPAIERREHARTFNSAMESHPPRMGPLRRLHVVGVDPPRRKIGAPGGHHLPRLLRTGVRRHLDGAYPSRALAGGAISVFQETVDPPPLDSPRLEPSCGALPQGDSRDHPDPLQGGVRGRHFFLVLAVQHHALVLRLRHPALLDHPPAPPRLCLLRALPAKRVEVDPARKDARGVAAPGVENATPAPLPVPFAERHLHDDRERSETRPLDIAEAERTSPPDPRACRGAGGPPEGRTGVSRALSRNRA